MWTDGDKILLYQLWEQTLYPRWYYLQTVNGNKLYKDSAGDIVIEGGGSNINIITLTQRSGSITAEQLALIKADPTKVEIHYTDTNKITVYRYCSRGNWSYAFVCSTDIAYPTPNSFCPTIIIVDKSSGELIYNWAIPRKILGASPTVPNGSAIEDITLYRHTIKFSADNFAGVLTAISRRKVTVGNLSDLKTVLGETFEHECSGYILKNSTRVSIYMIDQSNITDVEGGLTSILHIQSLTDTVKSLSYPNIDK